MRPAAALLMELRARGISLRATPDGRLKWTAPSGAVGPGELEQIRCAKPDLLVLLRREQAGLPADIDVPLLDAVLRAFAPLGPTVGTPEGGWDQFRPGTVQGLRGTVGAAEAETVPVPAQEDAWYIYQERLAVAQELGMSVSVGSAAELQARRAAAHPATVIDGGDGWDGTKEPAGASSASPAAGVLCSALSGTDGH